MVSWLVKNVLTKSDLSGGVNAYFLNKHLHVNE